MLQALLLACLLLSSPAIYSQSQAPANAPAAAPAAATLGQIKHIVIVLEENADFVDTFNSSNMPYLTGLINQKGALATNFYANTHPSIGNYMELVTGQILTNDDSKDPQNFPVSVDNIVRELLAAGLTWKAYCEDIPSVGYVGGDSGNYAVRHCPLPYLTDVQNSTTQRQNLVPFTQFATDLANNNLPNFSFVTPNLCNDAHDCSLNTADTWLQAHIDPLVKSPTFNQDTLLIVVFDEDGSGSTTHGGGQIEWGIVGATVKQGYQSTTSSCGSGSNCFYQHQSTLRLILKTLGVSVFPGAAATAPDMTEFFNAGPPPPAPAVSLSPTSLSFGNQAVGTTSSSKTVTLTNSGNAALSITNIVLTGTNSNDFAQTNNCPSSLGVGANCVFNVTFMPPASGARSASLQITDNATGSPHTVSLTGTGAAAAASLSPSSISFGSVPQGTTSSVKSVTLSNTGTSTLSINSGGITLSGANAADFAIANSSTCSSGGSVAAGSSCQIDLTFRPSTTSGESATLNVSDSAPTSPQSVSLSGTGTAGSVSLSPGSLTFAGQLVGSTSGTQAVTLTNNGGTLSISSITITGANSGDFAQTNTCGSSVNAGANCNINVTFKPTATGARGATLNINDNAAGSPQTVGLSGTGTVAGVQLAPTSLGFGNQAVGSTSSAQAVTLTNNATGTLTINSITISGANSGDFAETDNCGASVNAGASCTINVTFKPTASGSRSAMLSISDNAAGSPHSVALSGIGIATAPGLSVTPTSLAFGNVNVGSNASQNVTLQNAGNAGLAISQASVTGSGFSTTGLTTPLTLAAGQSSSFSVRFAPAGPGNFTGSIALTSNAPGSPAMITLSGSGATSGVQLSPASLSFASQAVGTMSSAQAVKLTNGGTATLNISTVQFAGANSSDFSFGVGTTCTNNSTVGAGASCTINVLFKPSAAGNRSATLSIADSAAGAPHTVALTGAGAGGLSITPAANTPTSQSVAAGQTAIYNLQVTAPSGFSGQVALSCSGAPAGATCSVAPAALTLSANSAAAFTVTVITKGRRLGGGHALLPGPPLPAPPSGGQPWVLVLMGALAVVLFLLPNRVRSRKLALAAPAAALVLIGMLLSGCTGLTGSAPLGTPAGTYTLTISATSAAGSSSMNLALTVK